MPSHFAQLIVSTRAPRFRNNQVSLLLREGVDRDTDWNARDWIKGRVGQAGAIINGRDVSVTVEQPRWKKYRNTLLGRLSGVF